MAAHTRQCRQCNTEFVTTNARRLRCDGCTKKGGGNTARTRKRLVHDVRFIGVDGEGVDRPSGEHDYVMLSVGEHTLWKGGRQLTIGEILSFLWEQYCYDPGASYIGFFLGYDFIQWEKQLPEDRARLLLTNDGIAARTSQVQSRPNPYPDAVVVETDTGMWEIDIMAGRRWKLRPHTHHRSAFSDFCRNRTCQTEMIIHDVPELVQGELEWRIPDDDGRPWDGNSSNFWGSIIPVQHRAGSGRVQQRVSGWLYICDTGPFWQTGFLNVINPKSWTDPVCTDEEYDVVVRGKADRGILAELDDTSYFEDMRRYNILENDILARVTTRLNEGFMNDAIPIRLGRNEWYGPGRAAQTWMDMLHGRIADKEAVSSNKANSNRYRVNDASRHNEGGILNADVYQSMPAWAYNAAQASYYGGWFEQMVHGHCGDVWEYDINSAYPYIIASLPCLHTHGTHNGIFSRGDGNSYPTDKGTYTLLYADIQGGNPYIGAMPYRDHRGLISRPQRVKGWYWLHEVEASKRAGLVSSMDVLEWVSYRRCDCAPPFDPADIGISRMYNLRLQAGKNSPQGKALKLVYNSAYGKTAQSIGTPKYSNPFYASLITAGCRTLILDAIARHPQGASAVTMVATDGVYFLSRHPSLELSPSELGKWDETFKPGMTQLMPGVYWDDSTRESIGIGGTPKLKSRGVNAKDLAKQISALDYEFAQFHENVRVGHDVNWPTITFNVNFLLDSAKLALQRGKWETAGRVQHNSIRRITSEPSSKRNPTPYRDPSTGLTRTTPYRTGTTLESTPYNKQFGMVVETDLCVDRDGTDGLQAFRDLLHGAI